MMAATFPHIDFKREVTIGHLMPTSTRRAAGGKVNPPIRRARTSSPCGSPARGDFDWVVSDHACCRDETKFPSLLGNVWMAKSGFGGTEYLLPAWSARAEARHGLQPHGPRDVLEPRAALRPEQRATSRRDSTPTSRSSISK